VTEDQVAEDKRQVGYRLQALLSPNRILDPQGYAQIVAMLFDESELPAATVQEGPVPEGLEDISFPSSDEEFDALMAELDAEEAAAKAHRTEPQAESAQDVVGDA
jgi:hypothetical protein